jgi:hypothetical protein
MHSISAALLIVLDLITVVLFYEVGQRYTTVHQYLLTWWRVGRVIFVISQKRLVPFLQARIFSETTKTFATSSFYEETLLDICLIPQVGGPPLVGYLTHVEKYTYLDGNVFEFYSVRVLARTMSEFFLFMVLLCPSRQTRLVHRTAATPFHIISSSLFINHQDA